jgi:hypothetical protein
MDVSLVALSGLGTGAPLFSFVILTHSDLSIVPLVHDASAVDIGAVTWPHVLFPESPIFSITSCFCALCAPHVSICHPHLCYECLTYFPPHSTYPLTTSLLSTFHNLFNFRYRPHCIKDLNVCPILAVNFVDG